VSGISSRAPSIRLASPVKPKRLDQLLGGGLDRGTSALFIGPAGCGKSALAMHFAVSATRRGETGTVYAFDESLYTLTLRSAALGIDIRNPMDSGGPRVRQVDPAEMAPGELVAQVRTERAGHEVIASPDATDALERLRERPPGVMLIDIGLPGRDGYELAREVRQALGSSPFLIAITGYGQPSDRRRALEAGFDEHLTKPVDLETLESKLEVDRSG
jgi:CheY-like chemotaxis protein